MKNELEEAFIILKALIRDVTEDVTRIEIRCDKIESKLEKLEEK